MLSQLQVPPSRKQAMVDDLRRKIDTGHLAHGTKLLATKELAHHYGVAIQTAHNAVTELVRHGYLLRRMGHGTFVAQPPVTMPESAVVGLALSCEGDVWSDFSATLVRGLSSMRVQPVLQDVSELRSSLAPLGPVARRLLATKPTVIIAQSALLSQELRRASPTTPVICIDSEPSVHSDYDRVIPDNYACGHRAGELLVAAGCRRVAAYSIMVDTQGPWRPAAVSRQMIQGCQEALEEAGGELVAIAGVLTGTDGRPTLAQFFASRPWPEGIFCTMTHRAVELLKYAREQGIAVPDDIAVIGIGETPLAQAYDLSAIDLGFDRVAAICLDLVRDLLAGRTSSAWWRQYTVEPRVVVRRSCQPPLPSPTTMPGATA